MTPNPHTRRGRALHTKRVAERGYYYATQDTGETWCRLWRAEVSDINPRLIGTSSTVDGAKRAIKELTR